MMGSRFFFFDGVETSSVLQAKDDLAALGLPTCGK